MDTYPTAKAAEQLEFAQQAFVRKDLREFKSTIRAAVRLILSVQQISCPSPDQRYKDMRALLDIAHLCYESGMTKCALRLAERARDWADHANTGGWAELCKESCQLIELYERDQRIHRKRAHLAWFMAGPVL